jgi:hypothetical protein
MSRPATIATATLVCLTSVIALACSGSDLTLPSEVGPATISKIRGDNQRGSAGSPLPDSLVVQVIDAQGQPVANQPVVFQPDAGTPGAVLSPNEVLTGADGTARTLWVLGPTRGTQAVVAQVVGVDGLEVRFEALVDPGEAARISAVSGDNQTAAVGTALPEVLVVLVTDQFGNAVPSVQVEWDAQQGSVDPRSSTTDSEGRAATSWVLGQSTGVQTATASSDGLNGSPVTFTGTAVAGSAASLVRVSGNNQTGRPGQELDEPLVVRLIDSQGNGIPNRAVSWVIGAGGGTVSSVTTMTDANGEASVRWTLGPETGTNTLNAVVSGIGVVGFTATATNSGGGGGGGSVPSQMVFRVQPSDVEHRHDIIRPPVEVEVLDQFGNRVTDREFTIRLDLIEISSGKSKGFDERRTEGGVAIYPDLHMNVAGEFRLLATTDGLPSVASDSFVVHE